MTKEQLIQGLNDDLAEKLASASHYVNHAALIGGTRFMPVQAELLVHAIEDMLHAMSLAEHIPTLGAPPTQIAETKTPKQLEEMLRQDLAGEKAAVARYKERIRAAVDLGEYGLAGVLQDIVVTEEEHVKDLEMALGAIENPGLEAAALRDLAH